MKNCTSIEQSKKLIELGIDVNTADMHYYKDSFGYYIEGLYNSKDLKDGCELKGIEYIPAWSLTALIKMLPEGFLLMDNQGETKPILYSIWTPEFGTRTHFWKHNLVDAVFEMIVWLKENNKL